MSLESITNEIIELNEKIKKLEVLREEELKKEEYWYLTEYPLEIESVDERLTIHANYDSYHYARDNDKADFLYVEIFDKYEKVDTCIDLNIEQAKQLSEYLNKTINYMESK